MRRQSASTILLPSNRPRLRRRAIAAPLPTAIFDLQDNDPLASPNDTISWDNANNERLDTLPDGFQAPVENAGVMPEPAEELILPSIDEAQLASNSSSSSTGADDAFTMPDLPDIDEAEEEDLLDPSEEFSLDMNPADPGPPPMDFPLDTIGRRPESGLRYSARSGSLSARRGAAS